MTAIIGIIADGRVLLAADSCADTSGRRTVRRDPKVFTTSFRMGQLLHHTYAWEPAP